MSINETMEDLYEIYQTADKKDKPGVHLVLDTFYGRGYVDRRERLAETIRQALVESQETLTTADRANFITASIINKHGIGY